MKRAVNGVIITALYCVLVSGCGTETPTTTTQSYRLACVGDSITYGYKIKDRNQNSYPARLGKMLPYNWKVINFGVSRMTMLRKTEHSYWQTKEFQQSLDFKPTHVIIMLGTNDQWQRNWNKESCCLEFKQDCGDMLDKFLALTPKPKIWICLPIPIQPEEKKKTANYSLKQVSMLIKEVAKEKHVATIDMYEYMKGESGMYADNLHPNATGAHKIATKVYNILSNRR